LGDARAVRPILKAMRDTDESLRDGLVQSLRGFGAAVEEPALEELEHPRDRDHRAQLIRVLRSTGARSDGLLSALLSDLEGDVGPAARLLASYGDVRALPKLREKMNALLEKPELTPEGPEALLEVAHAYFALGGLVTDELDAKLGRLFPASADEEDEGALFDDAEDEEWIPAPDAKSWSIDPPRLPVQRATPKIGRNEPCWCGSGRKYKKCHLGQEPPSGTN
jgi:hypothetical protein